MTGQREGFYTSIFQPGLATSVVLGLPTWNSNLRPGASGMPRPKAIADPAQTSSSSSELESSPHRRCQNARMCEHCCMARPSCDAGACRKPASLDGGVAPTWARGLQVVQRRRPRRVRVSLWAMATQRSVGGSSFNGRIFKDQTHLHNARRGVHKARRCRGRRGQQPQLKLTAAMTMRQRR